MAFTVYSNAQTKVQLNLVKGETYAQTQNTEAKVNQEIMGQTMEISMSINGRVELTVADIKNGIYTLKGRYTNLAMNVNSMGSVVKASTDETVSDNPVETLMSNAFKAMINEDFDATLSPQGELLSIDGFDKIYQKLVTVVEASDDVDDQTKMTLMNQVKQSYSPDALKSNFEMYMNIYPGNKVKVNDTWKMKKRMLSDISGTYNITYKLVQASKDKVVIGASGDLKVDDNPKEINGMSAVYKLNGGYDAIFNLDPISGWVDNAKIVHNMSGDVEIAPNDQLPDGMSIPLEMKGNTTLNK